MSLKPTELTLQEEGKKCGAKLAKSVCKLLNKPRFNVGDTVYGKPVLAICPGKIIEVIPAETTERKIPAYIVCFENWGEAGRYEDELYATEKEANEANN